MDIPTEPRPDRRRRRRVVAWIAGGVAVLVVLGAIGIWWFFRGDAPAEVSLDAAAAALDEAAEPSGTTEPEVTPDTTTAGTAAAVTSDGIAGTWTVDPSIGTFSFDDSTGTFVGFRVEEQLSGIGSTTAVGRTPAVTGTMAIEGTTVASVSIEADMAAMVTNDSRRDDKAQDALETDEFPSATFVLTEPIELGDAAASGEAVQVDATGELTVHGTTNPVSIPLEAQLVDGVVVVVGSVPVVFADYGVSVPSAPIVVSAEDHGIIELQLFFAT
ncbi:MAG: YceI family protein [Ilumatobacteraceae bacterium]